MSNPALRLRVGLAGAAALILSIWAAFAFEQPRSLPSTPVDLAVPALAPDQLGQWCMDRQKAGTSDLSYRAQAWLADCVTIFGAGVTPTGPSPSPTATPSPTAPPTTPTASPTVTRTTTAPAPTTTTPRPTATSTTTSPTGCMSRPSGCGWPDETNTGPTGALTTVYGSVTLSTPGQVYENRDVRGCVIVKAQGVKIRNVKITCGGKYAISVNTGTSSNVWNAAEAGLVVENVEIDMAGQLEGKAIAFDGYTLRRTHIHGGSDCAHAGVNVVIVDSFCDILPGGPQDGPHYDGIQSDGGRNITIQHNTIRVPYGQTAAILMSTNTSSIRDVSIVGNLVAGGGYTIYCGTDEGGPVLGSFSFSGNVVTRTYFSRGGYWGPTTGCPTAGWQWG